MALKGISQTGGEKHITIAYDISQSMLTVGMLDQKNLNSVNDFLLSRLFDKIKDNPSVTVLHSVPSGLGEPLISGNDRVTFGLIGTNFNKLIENTSITSPFNISGKLPTVYSQFNQPLTNLNEVFEYYIDQIPDNFDPILVLITDELQSGVTPAGAQSKVLAGFNNYHIKPVETYQFNYANNPDHALYIKVYRLSPPENNYLTISGLKNNSISFITDAKSGKKINGGFILEPVSTSPVNAFNDIVLSVQIFDTLKNMVADTTFYRIKIPVKLEKLLTGIPDTVKKGFITFEGRYKYNDRIIRQNIARYINFTSEKSSDKKDGSKADVKNQTEDQGSILWLLIIVLILICLGLAGYYLYNKTDIFRKKEKFKFQNIGNGQSRIFELKTDEILVFSSDGINSPGKKIFDLKCPGYSIKYAGNEVFELLEKGVFKQNLNSNTQFEIKNNINNKVEIKITTV